MSYRTVRLLGPCPCCRRERAELYVCTCGCPVTGHRTDLKHARCERCRTCRQYLEAPNQPDIRDTEAA